MAADRCTTCGSQLAAYGICPHCGSLIGVENVIRRVRGRLDALIETGAKRLPRRLSTLQFLWICALIPLVIVPPILSLLAAVTLMGRPRAARWDNQLEWIVTLSAINLLLSGLVLYRFHFSLGELGAYLRSGLFPLLLDMLPTAPSAPQPPGQAMPV